MKHELMRLKQDLAMARRGYDLLELKRRALWFDVHKMNDLVQIKREATAIALARAYDALHAAYENIGTVNVERIRMDLNKSNSGLSREHIPLAGTTTSLDEAFVTWRAAVQALIDMVDAENTLNILNQTLRKTSKRASALKNIRIPQSIIRIKYIENKLEENEREAVARLKLITKRP